MDSVFLVSFCCGSYLNVVNPIKLASWIYIFNIIIKLFYIESGSLSWTENEEMLCWFTYIDNVWIFFTYSIMCYMRVLLICLIKEEIMAETWHTFHIGVIYYVDIYSMWLLRMGRLLEKTNLFFAIGNGINVKLISPYMSPHANTTRIHAQVQISDTLYLLGRLAYAQSGRNTTKKLML